MLKKLIAFSVLSLLCLPLNLAAVENAAEIPNEVGISPVLGSKVDLSLKFTDSKGVEKPLSEFISGKKPVLITPVYYDCPRLCGLLLSGTIELFNKINLNMAEDYEVLTVSFDPDETPAMAKTREDEYKNKLSRPDTNTDAWHFLVGKKENINVLMQQIGFKYYKDADEFAHTAAIIILTAQGEISQYFTGINFSPWDSKLAIIEASQGKMGGFIDHILLYCFRYDHAQGKYTWAVFNLVRVVGLTSIVVLLSVVLWAVRSRSSKSDAVKIAS